MAIDARIPLMSQAPERIDPFASLGKVLQIKEYQQQSEARARKLAKEQQFDAIAAKFGDDPEELVKQIYRVDPEMGAKLSKLHAEGQREMFLGRKAKGEAEVGSIELATRKLQSIADGDVGSLAAWRAEVVSLDPQLNTIIPPPEQLALPEVKARVSQMGVSTATYQAAENKAMEMFAEGKFREGLGNALAAIPSLEAAQQKLEEARKMLPKAAQSDIAVYEQILASADGLPAFQEAAGNAALDVKQRADLALSAEDNQRQAAAAKETARHNQATEGISRGHLGVSQAQLGIARERLAQDKKTGGKDGAAMTPSMKAGIGRLRNTIGQLKSMDKGLTQERGLAGKVAGRVQSTIASWTGTDENATVYDALADTLLPALARASGEVGNLAQQEQERYGKLAPRVTDPVNVRHRKIQAMEQLVAAAENGATADEMRPLLDFGTVAQAAPEQKKNPFRK